MQHSLLGNTNAKNELLVATRKKVSCWNINLAKPGKVEANARSRTQDGGCGVTDSETKWNWGEIHRGVGQGSRADRHRWLEEASRKGV